MFVRILTFKETIPAMLEQAIQNCLDALQDQHGKCVSFSPLSYSERDGSDKGTDLLCQLKALAVFSGEKPKDPRGFIRFRPDSLGALGDQLLEVGVEHS